MKRPLPARFRLAPEGAIFVLFIAPFIPFLTDPAQMLHCAADAYQNRNDDWGQDLSTGSKLAGWRRVAVCLALGLLLAGCSGKNTYNRDYDKLPKGSYSGKTYTVKRGDTLYYIAWITDSEVSELARINKIRPPYSLEVGQKLRLSGSAPAKTAATRRKSRLPPQSSNKRRRRALPAAGAGRPAVGSCRHTQFRRRQ